MHALKKKSVLVLATVLCVLASLFTAVFVMLFTNIGSSFITKKVLKGLADYNEISWKKNEGSLAGGMVYENVEIQDLEWFSTPNTLRVQKITVNVDTPSLSGVLVTIDHARLILPDADPIIVSGNLSQGILHFELYSKSFSMDQIKPFLADENIKDLSGELAEIDIAITGSVFEPQAQGTFAIEHASKNGFSISSAHCSFDLTLKDAPIGRGLHGFLELSDGNISGKKTALITLQKSRITFDGDPMKPSFNIKATSKIEKTKMEITLTGRFDKPDIQIQSNPSLSKERALVALATNKTWSASDKLLETGVVTPEMTREFLDYFFFSSPGNKFAQRFGLTDLSIKFTENSKGLSASKSLSSRLEGTYEVEEKTVQNNQPEISQKVGGELQVTDGLSIEAKKEIKQQQQNTLNETQQKPDDQILLKYKKTF